MNNEPYAWVNVNNEYTILFDNELPNAYPTAWMPLYTNSAEELSEENLKILNEICFWLQHQKGMMAQGYAKDMAKIIVKLKKASDEL